jgi:hypothetical protein
MNSVAFPTTPPSCAIAPMASKKSVFVPFNHHPKQRRP